ncbi:hypothetical protein TKK_0015372 [Trichogramma kaykai]|uniref:Uncharacterized protein n=1 Tax=Trichogramma kaykai TaxID=54128 RepID=A0ABD2WAU3_9HYME
MENEISDRSHSKHLKDLKAVEKLKKPIRGTKGISLLLSLPNFDIVWDLPPDYMRGTLLGVTKQLWNKWLSAFISKDNFQIIVKRMLHVKLCGDIRQSIRSLEFAGKYKATEWRTWLLFLSLPVMKGILDEERFQSYCLFVDSIYCLLTESIKENDLNRVEYNLLKFAGECEQNYDPAFITFNVHSLTHYRYAVEDTGPLWTTSAFPFENGIFLFMKEINAPNGCLGQIAKKWLRRNEFENFLSQQKNDTSHTVQYCNNLFYNRPPLKNCTIVNDAVFTGKVNNCAKIVKHVLGLLKKTTPSVHVFHRCIFKKMLLHGIKYTRCNKTNDSVIKTINDDIFEIHYLLVVNDKCYIYGRRWKVIDNDFGLDDNGLPIVKHFIKLEKKETSNSLVEFESIKTKMLVKDTSDDVYLTSLPNNNEVQ